MPFPWLAAAIFGSSALGVAGTAMTNKAQAEASDKQMAFQREMSGTAHQREVRDLRKAGLNPILSSKYGGASTPTGAMPVLHNPLANLSIAKMIADVQQTKELTSTEKTKQAVNKAEKKLIETQQKVVDANSAKAVNDSKIEKSWFGKYILSPIRTTIGAFGNAKALPIPVKK